MGGRTAVRPYNAVLAGWVDAQQCVPTISPFHYFTLSLFNDFHLRHLITLTNLIYYLQALNYTSEACVIAVEVSCIVA
jgi:hypothetical protein